MGKSSRITLFSCIFLIFFLVQSSAQVCRSLSFSSNQNFATCNDLPHLNAYLYWNYDPSTMTAEIAFRRTGTTTNNWVAWGLNPSGPQMLGTQAILAFHDSAGRPTAYPTAINSLAPAMQRGNLSFAVSNVRAEYSNNEMIIFASLQLDNSLVSTTQVWQVGTMSGANFNQHAMDTANRASVGSINFATGTTVAGSAPSSSKKNVHGVLNAVSWGVLMPMGVMMARYLKVFKVANPAWFYAHVACQSSAYIIGVAGWGTGLKLGSDSPGIKYSKHRNIGITLFCFATLQLFALLLRPKPDHKYRLYWNMYHHAIGYATISLSIVNVYEGLDILDPEKKWKRIYTGVIIFLGALAVVLEAITWFIVIKRKKTAASDKHTNGTNGYNGV
ncbi:cytochrome b561 and DOMON domain-containing protein At5g35735-like [Mercurialis annua]|uniref:cytochrome b561 and DOMON domain-containing protein At5g35735-like n=1 Tax=Mercurialis annua TaxID=3986 RepID=UPI00215FA76B|nr:cytochrome b561 and DOMON domain-containing protein At5g35735-like [Mercurialis annua]